MITEDTLRHTFGENAPLIYKILTGEKDPKEIEAVDDWIRQCYNEPSKNELIMCACDALINGFGVEAIWSIDSETEPVATYVNMGDSYAATILYNIEDEEYEVCSWGDWVEENERTKRYTLK